MNHRAESLARRAAILALAGGLACASEAGPSGDPARVGSLPTTFEECVRSGGDVEAEERGGRCYSYHTPRADSAAYVHCRNAGGVLGVRGPGRSRVASGQSHVCTLIFEPGPRPR